MLQLARKLGFSIKNDATTEDKIKFIIAISEGNLEKVKSIFERCRYLERSYLVDEIATELNLVEISGCSDLIERIQWATMGWIFLSPENMQLSIGQIVGNADLSVLERGQSSIYITSIYISIIQYIALLPWTLERAGICEYLINQQKMNFLQQKEWKTDYYRIEKPSLLNPIVGAALFNDSSMISYLLATFPQIKKSDLKIFFIGTGINQRVDYEGNILHAILQGKTSRESKQARMTEILPYHLNLLSLPDSKGCPPFYYLAAFNLLTKELWEVVKETVQKNDLLDFSGFDGVTPLTWALHSLAVEPPELRKKEWESIQILLSNGSWANGKMTLYQEKNYISPLHTGSVSLKVDEFKWLLEQRNWSLEGTFEGFTPLVTLVFHSIVKANKKIKKWKQQNQPERCPDVTYEKEKIKLLIERGSKLLLAEKFSISMINCTGLYRVEHYKSPSEMAISLGFASLAQILLNDEVRSYLAPWLLIAHLLKFPESLNDLCQMLKAKGITGISFKKTRYTREKQELYRLLLIHYEKQLTLEEKLHLVIIFEGPRGVASFLELHPEININSATKLGITPLFTALLMNNKASLEVLLKHPQIDPNLELNSNENGEVVTDKRLSFLRTPFYLAIHRGQYEEAHLILSHWRFEPRKYNQLNQVFRLMNDLHHPHDFFIKSGSGFGLITYLEALIAKLNFPLEYSEKDIFETFSYFKKYPRMNLSLEWIEKLYYYHDGVFQKKEAVLLYSGNLIHVTNALYSACSFAALGKMDMVHSILFTISSSDSQYVRCNVEKMQAAFDEYKKKIIDEKKLDEEEVRLKIAAVDNFMVRFNHATIKIANWDSFIQSFWSPLAIAENFALTVLLSDGFLALKSSNKITYERSKKTERYFKILQKLPMELQMVLCNRSHGSMRNNVLKYRTEMAIRKWLFTPHSAPPHLKQCLKRVVKS